MSPGIRTLQGRPAISVAAPFTPLRAVQSLDEWALRIVPDFPTVLMVLCHIATRLQQLHSAGVAHRDLKPANVLWRPKHHNWTLIDFGCAAEIGACLAPCHCHAFGVHPSLLQALSNEGKSLRQPRTQARLSQRRQVAAAGVTAPLSFSLTYAPPETVAAHEAGQRTIISDAAADMWALGIISFELLAMRRAFPRTLGRAAVTAQLAGRAPLPWEEGNFELRPVPELRILRRSVLACLARDAAQRPTSAELLAMWNNLFDAVTKDATAPADGADASAAASRTLPGDGPA